MVDESLQDFIVDTWYTYDFVWLWTYFRTFWESCDFQWVEDFAAYACDYLVWMSSYLALSLRDFLLFLEVLMAPYLYDAFRLVFGLLYPAYASYKAIKTKNVKEYVKWMMYWIVFALFLTVETFADIFISWFPFYYEVKIVFLIWLLSPASKGSSYLYRKFVHPQLSKRDTEIDEWLDKVHKRSYDAAFKFGKRVVNDATNIVLRTAVKGQHSLSEQMRSFSLNDVSVKDSQMMRRRQASLPESDEEIDNVRLMEDNKELSEKDEDDYNNYTETIEEYPISEAMRKQYYSTEAGLHRIREEPADIMTSSRTMRSSKTYTNKEQAHIDTYASLPRQRTKKKVKKPDA